MIDGRHDISAGRAVVSQLVRDQLPRRAPLPFQQLAEEPFGRTGTAIPLHQDVDHVSVLIHGPPQVVALAPDLHEDFVQVPPVTQPTLATLQPSCVLRSELAAPLPDRLVGNGDAPLREEFLNVAQTQ